MALAFQANERLPIPAPVVKTAPPRGKRILVQLPTWFWLDKAQWDARSATARAQGAWSTVTVTARWAADWHGSDGNGGTLPTITHSANFPVRVVQARSELIGGGS